MDVEGSGHSLSEVPMQHLLEGTEQSQRKSVRLGDAMDKIHTRHYHLNQSHQYICITHPSPLPEQVPYSYRSLPQYVHTLAVTTIHHRYIYCTPASAITRTVPFISTALHLEAQYTSVDVNAQSEVR